MQPLIVLLISFIVCIGIRKVLLGKINFRLAAIISMSIMFIFTAIAHFKYSEGMSMMIPGFIPFKREIVYATGLIEIMLAIGLLYKKTRRIAAISLIAFLILIIPANIHAAMQQVNYADVSIKGHGTVYLWLRIPLQVFYIAWIYFAAIFTRSTNM